MNNTLDFYKIANQFEYPKKLWNIEILDELLDVLNIKENDKILDIGCGNGKFVYLCNKKAKAIGIDIISEPWMNLISSKYCYTYDSLKNVKFNYTFNKITFIKSYDMCKNDITHIEHLFNANCSFFIIERSSDDVISKIFNEMFYLLLNHLCKIKLNFNTMQLDYEKYVKIKKIIIYENYLTRKKLIDRIIHYSPLLWFYINGQIALNDLKSFVNDNLKYYSDYKFKCKYDVYKKFNY